MGGNKDMKKLRIRISTEINMPEDFDVANISIDDVKKMVEEEILNRICGETYAQQDFIQDMKMDYLKMK